MTKIGWAVRELFSRDELPLDHPAPQGVSKESFITWLLKPEALEEDPVPEEKGRRPFLSWLLGREQLPQDPAEAEGRLGFLGVLFQPESLPMEETDKAGE